MNAARVLLVEDDPSIRRFVELALEDLPIELRLASSLAQARAELEAGPVVLVISDMMLPDGSGAELLHDLGQRAAPRPRLVAFSAGVNAERRAALLAMGVDEVLAKPVSLQALEACVRRALPAAPPDAAALQAAVDTYFGGNQALFQAYRAGCVQQFELDLAEGDTAAAAGDWPALRRLVHSLKTVLLTLGDPDGSALAAVAEQQAAAGQADAARQAWAGLRPRLQVAPSQR